MFRSRAANRPDALAILDRGRRQTYGELLAQVEQVAAWLVRQGIAKGDRVALIAENRAEFLELELACSRIGAVLACQNWRFAVPELRHCVEMVEPRLLIASARFDATLEALALDVPSVILESAWAALRDAPLNPVGAIDVHGEDPLLLLYTSGTTGRAKGAIISNRAEVARMAVIRMDIGVGPDDANLAWAPMFHIGGTDASLCALMSGAPVLIVDGFEPAEIARLMSEYRLGWLLLVPGAIEELARIIEDEAIDVRGAKMIGGMIDLVPPTLVARISRLLKAPFLNSFGATETGISPLSGQSVAPGEVPGDIGKRVNSMCDFRLVDAHGRDVAVGETGEAAVRGPQVFSGYWGNEDANKAEFVDGYFRMGDLFRKRGDGAFDFVDRSKYLIKSGGENIYPAEIERVLLSERRIADAVVVRRADPTWGEVPVAVVALADEAEPITHAEIEALCRRELASYKRPKQVLFVPFARIPRSTSGKAQRNQVEEALDTIVAAQAGLARS